MLALNKLLLVKRLRELNLLLALRKVVWSSSISGRAMSVYNDVEAAAGWMSSCEVLWPFTAGEIVDEPVWSSNCITRSGKDRGKS